MRNSGFCGLVLLALVLGGCNKKISLPLVADQRPQVWLTQAPVAVRQPYFYSYEMRWTGFDPDGRVDHYDYAVDPPDPPRTDTAWVHTTLNRQTFLFTSGDPESLGTLATPGGYHTFVIRAVDDHGLESAPVARSFFSYTVAPEVTLLQPRPNGILHPLLPPTVTFRWTGYDPDGVTRLTPTKYKFHLFREGSNGFSFQNLGAFFDSLRHAYPPNFAGWDSTTSDTFVQYQGLTPNGTPYLFAITCYDEAGAYDPIWSFDKNLLYFFVDYPAVYGPLITMYSDFFNYTYPSPGYLNDPRRYVSLEVPVRQPITVRWSADPGAYASMKGYRWAMDIARLDDETPRSGHDDFSHWSAPGLENTVATVGPFGSADTVHTFFIEAEDNNGFKSLGILSFHVVQPDFRSSLLFVNDTSFPVDRTTFGGDSIQTPIGAAWPSEAELDTFLFARGGVRWRYYPNGTLSPPGIFSGYSFDTLSPRAIEQLVVPLSTLVRYRHVVWFCDQTPQNMTYIPALQFMNRSGQQNNLATYARMGGQVWLMGGGGGYNCEINFNLRSNDVNNQIVCSSGTGELVPGRMMYDLAHWQSEFADYVAQGASKSPTLRGGWPGAPDYSSLPGVLQARSFATDPIWPERTANAFYRPDYEAEYITKPNSVIEDVEPNPDSVRLGSVLDTLYVIEGGIGTGLPTMTYYHGQGPHFVFSGFPLWFFRKPQAIAVADWVLQQVWGLPRQPLDRGTGFATAPARPAPAPRPAPAVARPARVGVRRGSAIRR